MDGMKKWKRNVQARVLFQLSDRKVSFFNYYFNPNSFIPLGVLYGLMSN